MGRPLCFALGLSLCLFGLECLVLDKAVLRARHEPDFDPATYTGFSQLTGQGAATGANKEFVPKEWMPWTFMGAGAIAMIYTRTLGQGGG
jgi:hypothetical protein